MFVRLAMDYDEAAFLQMAVANLEETLPGEPYNIGRLSATFRNGITRAQPTIFVVEQQRKVVGFAMAYICAFDYRDGHYITQRVIYVSPEHRGTRASVLLVRELVRWGQLIGAAKIDGGNDNSFNSDRTAAFLEHFGFKRVGVYLEKLLEERGDGKERRR